MATAYQITVDAPPLQVDSTGTIRIADTRVTLDTLVFAYNAGAVPEEIAMSFPSLTLNAIYGAITHYLNHKLEIDDYLSRRQIEATEIRRKVEATKTIPALRERLMNRSHSAGQQ